MSSFFGGGLSISEPISSLEGDGKVEILHLGDVMLGRHVGDLIADGVNPFLFVEDTLRSFDAVVGNLEGPITDTQNCQDKPYSFKFATTTANLLAEHNITGVSLANNHSYDCFIDGLADTRKHLSSAGVFSFGGGSIDDSYWIDIIDGKKIVFVGFDRTIGDISLDDMYKLIEEISLRYDMVVMHIHWGDEYETQYSQEQQEVAHAFIDKGVDVIIGHHPHVRQPVEVYNSKPIFYSLGNFVFDQNEYETVRGYGVVMSLVGDDLVYTLKPYEIIHTRPVFYTEEGGVEECTILLEGVDEAAGCSFSVEAHSLEVIDKE